jgi:hypothetical protein
MRYLSLFLILFCIATSSLAQNKTEVFEISKPATKILASNYNKFTLLDIRDDTSTIGIVQKGMFNTKAKLICVPALDVQLRSTFVSLIDNNAQSNELVLLLQQLNFMETTYALKEIGLVHFRGVFFARRENKYCMLAELDTIMTVQSMDVTKLLLKKGSAFIIDLLSHSIAIHATEYNLNNLLYLTAYDSLQKINLPLYTTTIYKNGAYSNFEELLQQQPLDTNVNIEFYKSGHWKSVQVKNKKGKFEEVKLKDWYAFVFNNKIYLSTSIHEVYPVEKKGNDFYFTGKIHVPASTSQTISMGVMFGLLGALASSTGSLEKAELKIDYKTGAFIRTHRQPDNK